MSVLINGVWVSPRSPSFPAKLKMKLVMNVPKVKKMVQDAAADSLLVVAFSVQKRVKSNLSKEGSGKLYPGNRATSSTTGEFPVTQTGRLVNSMVAGKKNMKRKNRKSGITITYAQSKSAGGAAVTYGYILETSPKLNREFVSPAVRVVAPKAARIFDFVFKKQLASINRKGPIT